MGAVDEDAVDGSVAGIVVAVAVAATVDVVAAAVAVVAGIVVVGAATAVVDDTVVAVAAEAAVVCTVVVDPRYCTVDIPDLRLRIRISAVPAFVSFYPKKNLECLHLLILCL